MSFSKQMIFDTYPYLEPRAKLKRALEEVGKDLDEFQAVNIGGTVVTKTKTKKSED